MSATSENTAFLNTVLNASAKVDNFLGTVHELPELTVLEQHLTLMVEAQQTLIRQLALEVATANDLLHKHHIKTS